MVLAGALAFALSCSSAEPGRPCRAVPGSKGWAGSSQRRAPDALPAVQAPCCWASAWLTSVRVAVVVGRRNRSASGPRPQCWTNSAPCRSRLLAGEAWSRVSARRAACSNAQVAIGSATVINANCRVRRFILGRIDASPVGSEVSRPGEDRRSWVWPDGAAPAIGRGSPQSSSGGRRRRARGCRTWPARGRSCSRWSTR
jgi:hypothetical protein